MKKILTLILLVGALLSVNATVADAVYDFELDTTISTSKFDSLILSNDSITVLTTSNRFVNGWTYYLNVGRRTGASKDTTNYIVTVDAYTYGGTLIGRFFNSDSGPADNAEGKLHKLCIGNTAMGYKYTIKIVGIDVGAATNRTVFNVLQIYKARPVILNRNVGR